jgi:hypothetical protein
MNERLKEIAVKAQVEHCISHVRLQEFAELIIRACLVHAEQEEDRFLEMGEPDLAYCMQNFQELIKQEFGV